MVPANHIVKLKESQKKDNYMGLGREGRTKIVEHERDDYTNCNWSDGTAIEGLVQRLEDLSIPGQVETIQPAASWRSTRILGRVLET